MKNFQKFTLKSFNGQTDGYKLTPLELKDFVDFEIKRLYYIDNIKNKDEKSGAHCHKKEKELFIIMQGSATAVIDKGNGLEDINLKKNTGIYVGNYIWHHFKNIQPNTIILALSSTNYQPDRSDYIEDYDDYIKIRNKKLLNRNK